MTIRVLPTGIGEFLEIEIPQELYLFGILWIGVRVLKDLQDEGKRVVREAPSIRVPALNLSAGADWVVGLSTQRQFFKRLGTRVKEHVVYPGFYHEVFHERDRHLPIAKTPVPLQQASSGKRTSADG